MAKAATKNETVTAANPQGINQWTALGGQGQEPDKSQGHVSWFKSPDGYMHELYKDAAGNLYRAPHHNVIDVTTKNRIGRWEAPPHLAENFSKMILSGKEASSNLDTVKAGDGTEADKPKAEDQDDAVHCRAEASVSLSAPEPWKQDQPVRFVYAPEGVHTITAGFRDGRITLTVVVDEATPDALQASFASVAGRRAQTPFADEEHEAHKATLRFPKDGTQFEWGRVKDSTGVLLAGGLPTSYGADAVNGHVYESWSPEFLTDADYGKARVSDDGHYTFPDGVRGSASNPARLVGVGFTIGALTNKPAFHLMPAVKAADKGGDGAVQAVETKDQRSKAAKEGWEKRAHHASESANFATSIAEETNLPSDHHFAMQMHKLAGQAQLEAGNEGTAQAHGVDEARHEWKFKDLARKMKTKAFDASPDANVRAASHGPSCFVRLAGLAAGLQVAHWAADTKSNAHKAIGGLYASMSSLADAYAEAYAGKTGELPRAGESSVVALEPDHTRMVEDGLAAVEEVKAELKAGQDDDLLNILADMEAAYNKARYLLKAADATEDKTMKTTDGTESETVTAAGTSEGAKKGWEVRHRGPGGYRLGELEEHQSKLRGMKEFFHPSIQKVYHELEHERQGIAQARNHLEHSDKDEGLYELHEAAKSASNTAAKDMLTHLRSGSSQKGKYEALHKRIKEKEHYLKGVQHVMDEHEHGAENPYKASGPTSTSSGTVTATTLLPTLDTILERVRCKALNLPATEACQAAAETVEDKAVSAVDAVLGDRVPKRLEAERTLDGLLERQPPQDTLGRVLGRVTVQAKGFVPDGTNGEPPRK